MNKMLSVYIREQYRYTQEQLIQKLKLPIDEVGEFVNKLRQYGILKTTRNSTNQKVLTDLIDEDIEITDFEIGSNEYLYVFTFVGVVIIGKRVLKCYPKYILEKDQPLEEMKQILKVLEKYKKSKNQEIKFHDLNTDQDPINELSIMLFLLQDYHENGIYNQIHNIIEINGEGEVLWDNTINETQVLISQNRPYYLETKTIYSTYDEENYFKKLHECILTEISQRLEEADLIELLETEPLFFNNNSLEDFGDKEYILYKINQELSIQFNTHKQQILITMYKYICNYYNSKSNIGLSLFGTNSFNLVWEEVCAKTFNNQLDQKLKDLRLPVGLNEEYEKYRNKRLVDIIEKPKWVGYSEDNIMGVNEVKDTLIPDLISIYKKNDLWFFGIFDAKYYTISLTDDKVEHCPGVGDVTKQYLYQLVYIDFIKKHRFENVSNSFLFPTDGMEVKEIGYAYMDIFLNINNDKLKNINVVLLPAIQIFNMYLSNIHINISDEILIL